MQLGKTPVVTQNWWTCGGMAPQELCFSSDSGNTQVLKLKDRVNLFLLGFDCSIVFSPFCLADSHVSNLLICNKNAFFLALLGLFVYLFLVLLNN